MTQLSRVRSALTGFPGGPGVATMYFLDTATAAASVHDFWESVALYMPDNVTITVEPTGDIIEDTTGELVGQWGSAPEAAVLGMSDTIYAAPVGAVVSWLTGTILDGRRLRGRTFIVPLAGGFFQDDGSLQEAARTALGVAAAALVTSQSASFVIWHRPREAQPADGSRPAVTARAGGNGLVTFHVVPDKVAVLRSRRD